MNYILEMKHVTKRFPGVTALNDVSIGLNKGEILAICGENGAGKSTLMKVLSGSYASHEYEGEIWIDGVRHAVKADDGVIVPQGARHNVVSTGSEPLRLYTLYGPPEHLDGTVHATVEEASADHEHFDGRTTE